MRQWPVNAGYDEIGGVGRDDPVAARAANSPCLPRRSMLQEPGGVFVSLRKPSLTPDRPSDWRKTSEPSSTVGGPRVVAVVR